MFKKIALIIVLAALQLLVAPAVQAITITYDFTSDHCTGTCGTAPFGTVTLTQDGSEVDVTVHLNDGSKFVKTGAGDLMAFKFNAVGVVAADISISAPLSPTLAVFTGPVDGDGTGWFDWGIWCPACKNGGGAAAFAGDIVFSVASASISDLVIANVLGNIFVADILSGQNGLTGPVDVSKPVPEPSTLLLLGFGLAGVGLWRRKNLRS